MLTQAWLDTVLDLLIRIERNTDKNIISTQNYDILDTIRKNFYSTLWTKSDWKLNEIKEAFEESIAKTFGKDIS